MRTLLFYTATVLIPGREKGYIPPKRPYSFLSMLDDILDFAAVSLVDNGQLSFWMPTANDKDQEIKVPNHPSFEIVSVCTQAFNRCKWLLSAFHASRK